MEFLSLLTNTGLGSIIGLVGSWLTKREERKSLTLKYDFDLKMAEFDRIEAEAEANHELAMADKQLERSQVEGDIAIGEAEVIAFQESLKSQGKTTGIKFVDAIKGLMRPLLTTYLIIVASVVAFKLHALTGFQSIAPTELLATYTGVIDQLLFLTSAAVTWWFGSRPSSARKN